MVVIPPGDFQMGAKTGRPQEEPLHTVTISESFAVGVHPVTVAQFRAFVDERPQAVASGWCEVYGDDGSRRREDNASWRHPNFEQADDHPVVCVSWTEAIHFARWLSTKTGRQYRLLTEAEWEYVARAGSTAETLAQRGALGRANQGAGRGEVKCCFGATAEGDPWLHTSPVEAYPANAFGVFDLEGNASELVADCVNEDYVGAPADGSAWTTADRLLTDWSRFAWTPVGQCFGNVQRGRAWPHPPWPDAWYARRGWWYPSHSANFFGFRVAADLSEEPGA